MAKGEKVELIYKAIAELRPYEKNARVHSESQIAKIKNSIERFGWRAPLIIDEKGRVLAGHGRLEAAKALGLSDVPCVVNTKKLSESEKRAYTLADNQLTMISDWDMELLNQELDQLKLDGWDIGELGFDPPAIEILEPEAGGFDEGGSAGEAPNTKRGDIYMLGVHRLMCGDATILADVQRLMNGDKADMVFTDPPYNVDYSEKVEYLEKKQKAGTIHSAIKNDKLNNEAFYQFLYDAFSNMAMVANPGSAIYICHADLEGLNFRKAMMESGWLLKSCIIWNKSHFAIAGKDYHWKHEPILYGWLPGASHNWFGDRKQCTVWEFDKPQSSEQHPTMKPIALIANALQNSTIPGHIVMDLFGGSGSTLMACEQTGRACRTLELDEKYCDGIIKRWEAQTGLKAVLLESDDDNEDII